VCWAVPAKVVEVREDIAVVDFGNGMLKEVLIPIGERIGVGDVVLVHAGSIISKVDERELLSVIELYRELLAAIPQIRDFDARKEVEEMLERLSSYEDRSS